MTTEHSLEKTRLRRTEGSWFMRKTLNLARNVKRLFSLACSSGAYFRYAHSPKRWQQRPCSHRPASCGTGSMISISTLGHGRSIPASSCIRLRAPTTGWI